MYLANKSITTHGFTSWSVSVMISNLNDYRKPVFNRAGSLYLSQKLSHAQLKLFIKNEISQPSSANFGCLYR